MYNEINASILPMFLTITTMTNRRKIRNSERKTRYEIRNKKKFQNTTRILRKTFKYYN